MRAAGDPRRRGDGPSLCRPDESGPARHPGPKPQPATIDPTTLENKDKSMTDFDESDERARPPGGETDRGGPGWPGRPARGGAAPPGLKRALTGLERAIGGLVAYAISQDEPARRFAVGALKCIVANPGGPADVLLPREGEAPDGLKAAVSDLVDAIGRIATFMTGKNEAARPIAVGVLARIDAIVAARLAGSIRGAGDAGARLRVYRALAELGLGMPEQALMLVPMEIGRHLDDDQDVIARALSPLTEARRRRR
jgi:hypothetical protein